MRAGGGSPEPRRTLVQYPGGLRARFSWGNSGQAAAVFALSEARASLTDLGSLVAAAPDRLCRAEISLETPAGQWTVRLASTIYDEPAALYWDSEGLLVLKYGFMTYGLEARQGTLRWSHRSPTPLVAILASSRLSHVIVQSQLETFAIEGDGQVRWRVGHSDVVESADLVGGRLVLTSVEGQVQALDPATGLPA